MESYVRYSVPFNIDKNENDYNYNYNYMETLTLRFFLYLMCSERKGNS